MVDISVAEMLKLYGKWIESKNFTSKIVERKKVAERQAYILIRKALEDKEILRERLQVGTVLYGLPEFGPPSRQPLSLTEDENSEIAIVGRDGTVSSREKKMLQG